MKSTLTIIAFFALSFFTSCGDDPSEEFLWAHWYATSIARHSCDNPSEDNPNVVCQNSTDICVSCVKLKLESDGNYVLIINIDSNPEQEVGTYTVKSGAIALNPLSGDSWELPITNSDTQQMTIELPRDGGCFSTISMKATDCP
jgi:hypothetical protein